MISSEIQQSINYDFSDFRRYNEFNEIKDTPRIKRLAEELLSGEEQKNLPSIDIYSLLESANIKKITFKSNAYGGGSLIPINGGFEIRVDKNFSSKEQRMTIAHEIGHTYFFNFDYGEKKPQRRYPVFDEDFKKNEECFCEMFAQELLMPSLLLKNVARNFPVPTEEKKFKVDYLIKLANLFEVPEKNMAEKLVRENIWEAIIFQLKWNEKKDLDFTTFSKNWLFEWIIPHRLPGMIGERIFPLPIPVKSDLERIANALFYEKSHKHCYEIRQPLTWDEFLQDIFPKEFYDNWKNLYKDISSSWSYGENLYKSQLTLWSRSSLFVAGNLDQVQLPLWFSSESPTSSKDVLKLRKNSAKIIGVVPLP